jgi:hypothetical protein
MVPGIAPVVRSSETEAAISSLDRAHSNLVTALTYNRERAGEQRERELYRPWEATIARERERDVSASAFLDVTTPSGRHYRVQRDQIHFHQHYGPQRLPLPEGAQVISELHLNFPDEVVREIWAEFTSDERSYSYAEDPQERARRARVLRSRLESI